MINIQILICGESSLFLFYQQIHEIFIDVCTLLFPVVADRLCDLFVWYGDRQIDARMFFFLELAADSILITGSFVVVS